MTIALSVIGSNAAIQSSFVGYIRLFVYLQLLAASKFFGLSWPNFIYTHLVRALQSAQGELVLESGINKIRNRPIASFFFMSIITPNRLFY